MVDHQVTTAEAARDVFLHSLPTLKAALDSVTTLELRLDELNSTLYDDSQITPSRHPRRQGWIK
jgi:hypothetical protein